MKIIIQKIISFYDEKVSDDSKHASSITGLVGEDIAAGLMKHYFETSGGNCEILREKPTEGVKKGKWLDRWLKVESNGITTYYQTEIKNWCSHSLGGKQIKLNATDQEVIKYGHKRFCEQWDSEKQSLRYHYVAKVLKIMSIPKSVDLNMGKIEPTICYWYSILSNSIAYLLPFYSIDCKVNFNKVHFFSLSIYLRILLNKGIQSIDIDMPHFEERIKIMQGMYGYDSI